MDANKNKMGYIIFTIVRLCVLSGICLWGIVVIKDKIFIEKDVVKSEEDTKLLIGSDYQESPNTFFAKDLAVLKMKDSFRLEDYYITNKVIISNHYYIDKDQVLWGYGRNEYGQLGNGSVDDLEVFYEEPVKIAENVVSVDASCNGYFCIYLTAEGELYGMGSNMLGLLGQEFQSGTYSDVNVTEPVLLMDRVAYARAGREAIVVLDKEGSVWWWGQYRTSYSTKYQDKASDLYWKITEDEKNPVKMLSIHPNRILENCIYVATGDTTGAAIGENGELYTWGLNIFGECGTEVTGDDFVRTLEKVLENVNMVWVEKIAFGDTAQEIPERADYSACYDFNMFVQLKDGQVLAAGKGIGEKEKGIELTGDLEYTTSYVYSDQFVPVETESYSEPEVRETSNKRGA